MFIRCVLGSANVGHQTCQGVSWKGLWVIFIYFPLLLFQHYV